MHFLNLFFHFLHLFIISFILIGWLFRKTRKLHLIIVLLTLFSWVVLGYFYGWGYCFITDWHWQVRDNLGYDHPASYLKLLADNLTSQTWNSYTIDLLTAVVFSCVFVLTLYINLRKQHRPA